MASKYVQWLSYSNDATVEKSVSRVMRSLYSSQMAKETNRTSKNGKLAMNLIEDLVKESVRKKHINGENVTIERALTNHFINARDKGGRHNRKRVTNNASN
ncbi:uncharacterized protein LOC124813836 [Hydra vulgaris]|uniref:uncharacterized protein LOC124813836 n=1 Tax=Hydra vulgaris TaxID=6087 RepID=UPI0032EA17A3